ncbi:MAG: signal peptidase I [Promethearchaeota archaeon]|nr:MAG: signal peptidase I [Candidatus Lokiarchaeota archaeon]
MADKKTKIIKNVFFLIFLLIFSIGTLLSFILLSNSLIVITSPSMRPTLNIGDLVLKTYKNPNEIHAGEENGDILVLKGPQYFYQKGFDPLFWNNLPNNTLIIHRAIAKKTINNTWYFLTKGDNSLFPDGAYNLINNSENYKLIEINNSEGIYVPETEILGIVAFKVPIVGYIKIYFEPIILSIFIMILIYIFLKIFNLKIKIERNRVNNIILF